MGELSALRPALDAGAGGVLLANMIEAWLVGNPEGVISVEATHELLQDHGTTPEQTGLHLCPPVHAGSGAASSGEHGAPVWAARDGAGIGLERIGDPHADEEVRGAVGMVFRLFRETGSAYAVVHRFAERGLRFPQRAYGGAWDGRIIWGRLSHSRVLGVRKNPSYAGMYVFGRYQYRREISPGGEVHKRMQAVAMPAWRVNLRQHHEGYITLEEFFKNQELLEKNRCNGEATVLGGPAREGLALLQGLLLCGNCGHALTVRYRGNGASVPPINAICCAARAWRPRPA